MVKNRKGESGDDVTRIEHGGEVGRREEEQMVGMGREGK